MVMNHVILFPLKKKSGTFYPTTESDGKPIRTDNPEFQITLQC